MHATWEGICIYCTIRVVIPVAVTILISWFLNKICKERNGEKWNKKESESSGFPTE